MVLAGHFPLLAFVTSPGSQITVGSTRQRPLLSEEAPSIAYPIYPQGKSLGFRKTGNRALRWWSRLHLIPGASWRLTPCLAEKVVLQFQPSLAETQASQFLLGIEHRTLSCERPCSHLIPRLTFKGLNCGKNCRQKLGLAPHCSGNKCLGVDPRGVFHALAGIASGQPGLCVLQISENHCGFGSWLDLI